MQRDSLANGGQAAALDSEAGAADSYRRYLELPGVARATAVALAAGCHQGRLSVNGKPLCNVLRPRFLSHDRRERLTRSAEALAALLERAGNHLLASDRLLDLVAASEQEREIWAIDPGYRGFALTSRLDAFFHESEIRFIEYNAESPAGIGFSDRLTEIFNDLPVTGAWRERREREHAEGRASLLNALLDAYREWGGTGRPAIAIIDWEDVITRNDFEICADYFLQSGFPTVIADPRRLAYRNGSLWLDDLRIDLVYRRVLLHELLGKSADVRPLLHAYRDGAICIVNSPRSKLLHKKGVFALLSEGELGLPMTAREKDLIQETIPWTRRLGGAQTEYRGESWDLGRLLRTHQDRFAIKPADDYGGRGIVLGWECSAEDWERVIDTSFDGEFVVQERVNVPTES
ncbi:MAG: hypothetical protein ACRDFX_08960, partial [Chloroflexota bacterium]